MHSALSFPSMRKYGSAFSSSPLRTAQRCHTLSFIFRPAHCWSYTRIRARRYRPILHTLCAISCPLLGLLVPGDSFAIASGLWFMANVAGDQLLKQMCFADTQHAAGPCVWRMHGQGVFPCFRHVILVGSKQDKYIPLYSSHMRPPSNLPENDTRIRALKRMVDNSLQSLSGSTLTRVTVRFPGQNSLSVDEAVGRAAHVAFIEHVPFIRAFTVRYARLFDEVNG